MSETDGGSSSEAARLWVIAIVALAALLLLHFTPLKAWMEDIRAIKDKVDALGWIADAGFVVASIAGVAIGVPRMALAGLAGALFGFVEGALLAIVSATLGSYGAFLLARWGGRAWAERKLAGVRPRIRDLLARPSVWSIILVRQVPAPGLVLNLLLGMLPISHWTFLVGTCLGYLPSTAIVALAGSSLGKESLATASLQITLSLAALALLSLLLMWLTRDTSRRDGHNT